MALLSSKIDPEKWTTQFLLKYGIDDPSIPVEKIAEKEGIELVFTDLGDNVSGVLVIKNGRATIGCNKADSQVRKRFTIAHELAHYFLHYNAATSLLTEEVFVDKDFFMKFRVFSKVSYDPAEMQQENEANAFAAALLMPKHLIEKELFKDEYLNLKEVDVIDKLAKTFKVSNTAMTYRMTNLNLLF